MWYGDSTTMTAFAIALLLIHLSGCFARECPRLVNQLGDPLALELGGFRVYVNLHEVDSGKYIILPLSCML